MMILSYVYSIEGCLFIMKKGNLSKSMNCIIWYNNLTILNYDLTICTSSFYGYCFYKRFNNWKFFSKREFNINRFVDYKEL